MKPVTIDKSSIGADGLPTNKEYLECDLPLILQESIDAMKLAYDKLDRGEEYYLWDCDWCELYSNINNAEVNNIISSEVAWYLREKYLGLRRY